MAWVYILQNQDNSRYYIGSTADLKERLKHHEGGHTPSTKRLGPIRLVFQQEYRTIREARSIERKLKRFKRRDYLERIIKDGHILLRP